MCSAPECHAAVGEGRLPLAECSRKKCKTRLADQNMGGMRGEGHGPFNCSVPDSHPKLGKNIFKMRSQDHPSLKGPVLFRLDRLPHLLGKYWSFCEKKR